MLAALYLAVFGCAAAIVMAVMGLRWEPAVRLPSPMFVERPRGLLRRVLELLGNALPRRGPDGEELKGRVLYAGSRITEREFSGIKILTALGGLAVAAVLLQESGAPNPVWLLVGVGVGFVLPDLWMRGRIAKRQRAIIRLLPEVIDLLVLSIGAGLDFLVALNKVVAIPRFRREPLIEELSMALQEIQIGKRRAEALKGLAKRLNIPELASFIRTVVQADRMGTPIADVLAVHSEDLRLERFMRAERAALQAPIKILAPLIFCIMPCVAIIVGAPILLQFMRQSPFGQ